VQVPVLPEEAPWDQKAWSVDSSRINFGSKQEKTELVKNSALEKIDSYKGSGHIFTDASKIKDNKTSAAFCVPEFNIEHSVRLTDNITIFAAELCAIKLDLHWVTSNSVCKNTMNAVKIQLTDMDRIRNTTAKKLICCKIC